MNAGGAETFLMKLYRSIDKENYQFDFCVFSPKKGYYDDEISSLGGIIYVCEAKTKNPIRSYLYLKKIVSINEYQYVLRISQNSLSSLDLLAAKMGGAKVLAFRSSNTGTCGSKKDDIFHALCKPLAMCIPNVKIAPSKYAAAFMFGNSEVKKGKVLFLNNGIDIAHFSFNPVIRRRIHEQYHINDKFVVGHVGRFFAQKNHRFLVSIFASLHEKNPNTVLLLVGDGEKRAEIEAYVRELNIHESVIFLGIIGNVHEVMMAMDLLILPSLFEGMPNVIVEAQASGLPCLIADTITPEAAITGLVDYMSLSDAPEKWAEKAISFQNSTRLDVSNELEKKGYAINAVVRSFKRNVFKDEC